MVKTHLIIKYRRDCRPSTQAIMQANLLSYLRGITLDTEAEQCASQTAPVAEHADAFVLQSVTGDIADQADETCIYTRGVHVPAVSRDGQ